MSTIQIRIEDDIKTKSRAIFAKLGIDMTTGISLFLNQVVIQKGIPMSLLTENGLTSKEEKRIVKASIEARREINVTKAMSPQEAITYLNKL